MANSVPKPENRLKAAIIERLYAARHVVGDAVLISEMVVDNWARRADVVLANGRLWGFEVKSEQDSLNRLPGQIESFNRAFEKLTIVTVPKFEYAVREMLPEGVGLWVEVPDGSLKERIRARASELSKSAAMQHMTATELRQLLSCNGISGLSGLSRSQLETIAAGLPASDLTAAARDVVKRKHRAKHELYQIARLEGRHNALSLLRSRTELHAATPDVSIAVSACETATPDVKGHPAYVRAPAGPVLKRIVRPTQSAS